MAQAQHARETDLNYEARSRPAPKARLEENETRRSFTTSEFYVWAISVAALIVAGYVNRSGLDGKTAWQLAALVSVAYIVSRGLAKIGSRTRGSICDKAPATSGLASSKLFRSRNSGLWARGLRPGVSWFSVTGQLSFT